MAIPANAYYVLDSHPTPHYTPNTTGSTNSARSHSASVKSELSSPYLDLSPSPPHTFSFQFPSSASAPNSTTHINHNFTTTSTTLPDRPYYRFGSMAHPEDPWLSKRSATSTLDLNSLSFPDEYDDGDDLPDPPSSSGAPATSSGYSDRVVRRRSSKACDQCRKSKCKCERAGDGEACKSCIMLGTPCTFLGPSRKRGPPKGYIDAIEARLHQTEALLGVLLAVEAEHSERYGEEDKPSSGNAAGLEDVLHTLRQDALAREILNRVDASSYGVKGRKGGNVKPRSSNTTATEGSGVDLQSTHPSNEWQDRVVSLLSSSLSLSHPSSSQSRSPSGANNQRTIQLSQSRLSPPLSFDDNGRRQRRRLGSSSSPDLSDHSHTQAPASTDSEDEDDVVDAVGQLSLNEDEQVRYHGKASGLYLLGYNAKEEARNEGGIWRFPKARVWPPLPPSDTNTTSLVIPGIDSLTNSAASPIATNSPLMGVSVTDKDLSSVMPDLVVQEHLLEIYFTYVHSAFPVLHKEAFWEGYKVHQNPSAADTPSPASDNHGSKSPSPFHRARRNISPLLLLSMFSIAERYSASSSLPPSSPPPSSTSSVREPIPMWTAGDQYFNVAKKLLDNTYASSMPSTVQALLLLGYREIGIGAMAQAWVYTGMAVRMAQDLGMHRAADGWARADVGRLFGSRELQERRRIWWGCVVLDGYVSSYIGRPLAIFERDYDTLLPGENEAEEMDLWIPHESPPPDSRGHGYPPSAEMRCSITGRVLSSFNASAKLSTILSKLVQSLYAIHPVNSRHTEAVQLEELLNKWYLDLPEHLQLKQGAVVPPHILTLHMQYWCTTLLLHRPFIRNTYLLNKGKSDSAHDAEACATSKKHYELCVGAANHISSIVSSYREKYCLQRAPVFLCFYVFTAGIMHVTSSSIFPNDPQSRIGLFRCMDALQDMEVVWPSAARANELLRGSNVMANPLNSSQACLSFTSRDRQKRTAEHSIDSEDAYERSQLQALPSSSSPNIPGSGQGYANTWRSTQFSGTSHDVGQESGAGRHADFAGAPISTSQPSYYPWTSDGSSYLSFPNTLSTSVLPQMYSTGLVDSRRAGNSQSSTSHPGQARSALHGSGSGTYTSDQPGIGRYPQFWNDYTSFPQMGMAYSQSHPQQQSPPQQDPMYMSTQYGGIYNSPTS
ncbi:fungal-specific transcription factor domain-containing protein [Suillus bovinus]|uniref:fungal-specific transcription factor domain-containing protein n=1 Tax=Suillus bovinus TaxID=48563 RepID=UPI001B8802BB|nr:fungal-specific transcription factor domain-containing protein [Suillus bovinus]KAG2159426.1 fungal-specific transcription factor domain-containing protein [Suillus bovinus]